MGNLQKNHLVVKKNVLNEMRTNDLTLQQLRFFTIYLSRINPLDVNTRVVKFSLQDFAKIMEFGRLNIRQIDDATTQLLQKVIKIPNEGTAGFEKFQLFKKCRVFPDSNSEWFLEIDVHDDALPLMFDLKRKFFKYELWNSLQLKSVNQLRMYELLKQHEIQRVVVFEIDELKELLGGNVNQYSRYSNFKIRVLDACQKSLELYTDIKYAYEPIKRTSKVVKIKFYIQKNENYKEKLNLSNFLENNDIPFDIDPMTDIKTDSEETEKENTINSLLSDACNNEFDRAELEVLFQLISTLNLENQYGIDIARYHYIAKKYSELQYRATKVNIKNRFAYFRKMIEIDVEKIAGEI